MATAGHHSLIESRLEALATRIADLKTQLVAAHGIERADDIAALKELVERHAKLSRRLRDIERVTPDARQGASDELQLMADDLSTAIADLLRGIEHPIGPAPELYDR
jgi:hypothetical protein